MSKIAALQLKTLSLSEARIDYYLKACKEAEVDLVVLGEYVLNSFFHELLTMPKAMIEEQSLSKKQSLIKLAQRYELNIIAPYIEVQEKDYKKICLYINAKGEISSYEQQILMPYSHWNEAKFFSNQSSSFKFFHFEYQGLKLALFFGFEAHFDIFWQKIRTHKIDLVLLPCACSFESKERWVELLKTRAFLNSVAILRVNRVGSFFQDEFEHEFYGDSLYINSFGELEDRLSNGEEMLIITPSKADEARKLWGFDKLNKKLKQ